MFQTKKANIKFTVDQKFYASIQQNETDSRPNEGCSQKIHENNYKIEKPSHPELITKHSEPNLKSIPSLINQRKISDNQHHPISTEATKCCIDNSQLIQQLIQENIKLKKQNLAKDSIINQLITNNDTQKVNQLRASTSQTERQCNKLQNQPNKQKPYKYLGTIRQLLIRAFQSTQEFLSIQNFTLPLNNKNAFLVDRFTFCNTEQKNNQLESGQVSIKSSKSPIKLPKEFQIIPSQKKYFV